MKDIQEEIYLIVKESFHKTISYLEWKKEEDKFMKRVQEELKILFVKSNDYTSRNFQFKIYELVKYECFRKIVPCLEWRMEEDIFFLMVKQRLEKLFDTNESLKQAATGLH